MALQLIGSGFGRTGTRSLKDALEILGLGPCHHMDEVFPYPEQIELWCAFVDSGRLDHEAIFSGFRSQVDWPGAHVWRQTAAAWPEAKVLHSVRPEESWWKSFSGTIGKFLKVHRQMDVPPPVRKMCNAVEVMVGQKTFGGNFADKDAALAAYRRREAEVRSTIAAERLLVFDVAEGWEPLCAFLDRPVPDVPFPRTNSRDEFWDRFGGEPA